MFSDQDIRTGEMCQFDEPDWQPLYDIVGVKLADWFMWMCEIDLEDGAAVHAYKHITTRCYFHLCIDGRAFEYVPSGRYREIDRREAIDVVFDSWEELATGPDDKDRVALIEARGAAGARPGAAPSSAFAESAKRLRCGRPRHDLPVADDQLGRGRATASRRDHRAPPGDGS